ncbi:MAG: hypothetical protein AB7U85_02090 [Alphaproteobacteria bacterium]
MTEHIVIGDVTPRIRYEADGEQTIFIYSFPIFKDEDLQVWLDSEQITTGFSISGAGESGGGEIVLDTAPTQGTIVTLLRNLVIERTSDFQTGGAFRAKVINDELDFQTAAIQQIDDSISRAFKLPAYAADINTEMPSPNAGKALLWNEDGDGLINSSDNFDTIVTSATAQAELAASSAASAASSESAADGYRGEAVAAQIAAEAARDEILTASGTQIGFKMSSRTSSLTTTEQEFQAVLTLAYTPKSSNSILIIEASGYRIFNQYYYGADKADAYLLGRAEIYDVNNETQLNTAECGFRSVSKSTGEALVDAPLYIRAIINNTSLTTKNFKLRVMAVGTVGSTVSISSSTTTPVTLTIKEIAV